MTTPEDFFIPEDGKPRKKYYNYKILVYPNITTEP
jgi:hypothetical protein